MNQSMKDLSDSLNKLKWQFIQMTRKIASICLEGAIILNN